MYRIQHFGWLRVFGFSAAFLLLTTLTFSCKKKESNIGMSTLDGDQLLNSIQTDTFELNTFTIADDSVITDNAAFVVLGNYNDPKFGSMNASFFTQLRLSGLSPNFGDLSTITVDSTVLGLEYAGFYGDLSQQSVEVFELTESLHLDSTYYSSTSFSHSSSDLVETGSETFTPNPYSKTVIGNDTVNAQLRIRLKNALGLKIITDAVAGGTNFTSNENFLDYFKGIHVKIADGNPPSGKGGVFYFNITAPLSKLTIYYSQAGISKKFDLLINAECADFSKVIVDNSSKPVQAVIDNPALGKVEYYAQAFKNRAVVQIPGIANFPGKTIVHKAELILPIQYQTNAKYPPSLEVSLAIKDKGKLAGIGVNGIYDNAKKHYKADIKNYMQALISEDVSTTELFVSPRFFVNSAERIIFNGQQAINKSKPKLVVTYTEF
jgi:hypothetical protein